MTDGAGSAAWPTGMLALVFTDVERSTELWQIDEDAFGWALMEHDHEVREALAAYGGIEVKHTGDGFFLVFADVGQAARFCLDLQTRLTGHDWPPELGPVRTRVGVHYGEPKRYGSDYRGTAVSLASRICAASQGGQILLSADAARELRRFPDVAGRVRFLGSFELPGIAEGAALYELLCDATRAMPRHIPVDASTTQDSPMAPSLRFSEEDRSAWERAKEAIRHRQHDVAVIELMALRERHPEDVRVLTMLGVVFAWQQEYERAEHCLRRAVEIDDRHASAWFNLARVYGKMGRRDAIAHALAMTLRADPSHAKAREVAQKYGVEIPDTPL